MKSLTKALCILLFTALPFSLLGQNLTLVAGFMKVPFGLESEYLEVEQTWKKLHQKAVNEGLYQGWQLWRKLHVGVNDPYNYCTLQMYENYEATFKAIMTPEWAEDVYPLDQQAEIIEKTYATRDMVSEEVYHLRVGVENPQAMKYLVIIRSHLSNDLMTDYLKMEREIWKPIHEASIRNGHLAQWGVWSAWPFSEGQANIVIGEGFTDVEQLSNPGGRWEMLSEVHPELTWEDVLEENRKYRKVLSQEVWELVDFVVPAE